MLQLDLLTKASGSERDRTVSDHAQLTSFGKLTMTPSFSKMSSVTMNSPRKGTALLATFLFDAQRTSSKFGVIIEPANGITYNVQALRDRKIDQ